MSTLRLLVYYYVYNWAILSIDFQLGRMWAGAYRLV